MAIRRPVRWGVFVGVLLVLGGLAVLRSGSPQETLVTVVGPEEVGLSLSELRALPALEQEGSYQNQFENWSTPARYRGVPLLELLAHLYPELQPESVTVVASDGYRLSLSRERMNDPRYPVVLAYAKDGVAPPAWEEGPRIVVLPEDGRVSNDEYGAESAGAYWVRDVVRLEVNR